jgi:hypothetical protein
LADNTNIGEFRREYDWFMVTRNPFDRILSEFHCRFGGVGNRAKEYTEATFNQYILNRLLRPEVKQFCCGGHVQAMPNIVKKGGHYSPQHFYLDPKSPIHVLRFEHLRRDFDRLMRAYDLPLRMPAYEGR